MTSFLHHNDVTDRRAVDVWLIIFLSFPWTGTVMIELSHMGKTTDILIWCARIGPHRIWATFHRSR